MKKITGQATGKLILSGEYAVVFGYPGIAVLTPFTTTATFSSGNFSTPSPVSSPQGRGGKGYLTVTHHGIENEDYLHCILNAVTAITDPLCGHLTIENMIPIGRGMGSSTALVIALCRCLLKSPLPAGEGKGEGHIKNLALTIENTVNPGHSGLDFAVIWEGKPVTFNKISGTKPIDFNLSFLENAVLIDTGKPNETTPEMVEWIKTKTTNYKLQTTNCLKTIAHCTERLTQGESLLTVFPDHHHAQVTLGIVPKPVQNLIAAIEAAGGAAKVVGAGGRTGGAGIVLALHEDREIVCRIAEKHHFPTLINPKI